MKSELRTQWDIILSSWIIQDGNYDDFSLGQVAAFALEWWGDVHPSGVRLKSAAPVGHAHYNICGEVVYTATKGAGSGRSHLAILDCGVLAYKEATSEVLPVGVTRGEFVTGEIGLGIDHYYYMEFHHTWPEIPSLTYTWLIERISQLSAPWIPTTTPWGAEARRRDPSRMSYIDIDQTRAWEDEGGHADYILHCVLLAPAPRMPGG